MNSAKLRYYLHIDESQNIYVIEGAEVFLFLKILCFLYWLFHLSQV